MKRFHFEDLTERNNKKIKIECPYLDTINKKVLDFDFEKVCFVTLSNLNVYCCLICGKFYKGRGKDTPVDIHSFQEEHHIFLNLFTKYFLKLHKKNILHTR
jgi:U4/U6.U5 tri-snRNP-associated protein 2